MGSCPYFIIMNIELYFLNTYQISDLSKILENNNLEIN